MYAVVRTYSGAGAKELFNLLEQRKADVEAVIRKVPGLVSYTLVRSAEGGIAVTVCQDQAGADESTRLAKEWIQEHASELGSKLPAVDVGSMLVPDNVGRTTAKSGRRSLNRGSYDTSRVAVTSAEALLAFTIGGPV